MLGVWQQVSDTPTLLESVAGGLIRTLEFGANLTRMVVEVAKVTFQALAASIV